MPEGSVARRLDPRKFQSPELTARGEPRARVGLARLRTLWFNTGTLCNIACANCYIDSNPTNDKLAYLTAEDVRRFLDEIARDGWPVEEIGFTGGEPFMNRGLLAMLEAALLCGHRALVLTNAMKPLHHKRAGLLALKARFGESLALRGSSDHYAPEKHEMVRGPGSWAPMIEGFAWLAAHGFALAVAGRKMWADDEPSLRAGYARLFAELGVAIDASDPARLVLFPEMDPTVDVPEITTACWGILKIEPTSVMCATSRMVVKRRGAARPAVLACTLVTDDPGFEMGSTLAEANRPVALNHPHCASFCVLGGATCSPR